MADIDSDVYDYIVFGTGVSSSLQSSKLAGSGKKILHVDNKHFYGYTCPTFSLKELISENVVFPENVTDFTFSFHCIDNNNNNNNDDEVSESQIYSQSVCFSKPDELTKADLMLLSSSFYIDIFVKLFQNNCELVPYIIDSNLADHFEFLPLGAEYIFHIDKSDAEFINVPYSKTEIFNNSSLDLLQKRLFYQHITDMVQKHAFADSSAIPKNGPKKLLLPFNMQKSFFENSSDEGRFSQIKDEIKDIIYYNWLFIDYARFEDERGQPDAFARRVLDLVRARTRFKNNSSFLLNFYGLNEFAQVFCRHSAVHGGTFMLNTDIKSVDRNEQSIYVVQLKENVEPFNERTVKCKNIIVENDANYVEPLEKLLPFKHESKRNDEWVLLRAVFITNGRTIVTSNSYSKQDDGGYLNEKIRNLPVFVTVLNETTEKDNKINCYLIEMTDSLAVCPAKLRVIHCFKYVRTSDYANSNVQRHFESLAERLFLNNNGDTENDQRPRVLFSCYFAVTLYDDYEEKNYPDLNISVCRKLTPFISLDHDV